ncbi:DUF742 domain-containing protein [Actinomycetospora endophytica]|uniref:DUF742 domain-containing protein n=1 Tax=Actinomycetospora endophytica TaxID=2291215 RepID=A0ABS8P7A0_9PSEU|nr:DUF742 domain-containing protein [Actinomycetospora endophytica]MCD2194142.1 DUF742 domain-containing protein [Actinomycetospora endophytica]
MSQGPDEDAFADVLNGITGGSPRRSSERRGLFGRRRKDSDDSSSTADHDAEQQLDGRPPTDEGGAHRSPPQGVPLGPPSGPQPGGWRPDVDGPQGRPPRPSDYAAPTTPGGIPMHQQESGPPDFPDGPRSGDEPPESSFVRPYAWTRGRTRPAYDLAVETLLSTTAHGRDPGQVTQYEHRMIADLCREPKSVAEVGALLSLPLGVARVLLGDMAAHGSIVVHETASSSGDAPDMALMERVLSGLRRL